MSEQVDSDGFQQVSKKRNQGNQRPRRNALANIHEPTEGRLTLVDLKHQVNLLQKRMHSPKVDLTEIGDAFTVRIEVPGLNLKDLQIDIQSSQFLLVSGYRTETEVEGQRIVYKESKYGKFTRRVKLPALVKELVFRRDVSLASGVLTIILIKKNTGQVKLDSSLDDVNTSCVESSTLVEEKEGVESSTLVEEKEGVSWDDMVKTMDKTSWADIV